MKNKLLILLSSFFISCSEEVQEIPEPIVEDPQTEDTFQYKTYKRITGLSDIESDLLKKHSDLDEVSREIMNIYDNTKGTPQTSSDTQE